MRLEEKIRRQRMVASALKDLLDDFKSCDGVKINNIRAIDNIVDILLEDGTVFIISVNVVHLGVDKYDYNYKNQKSTQYLERKNEYRKAIKIPQERGLDGFY